MSDSQRTLAYPHRRNDCDCCREFDADMAVDYDQLGGGHLRWCHRCAGQLLAQLVLTGHTVIVRPLNDPDNSTTRTPAKPRKARRKPAAVAKDDTKRDDDAPQWTVDLAEEILRLALPTGSVFLRALIDEGGTATAVRLKELTGSTALHYMTLTLNMAARKLMDGRHLGSRRHLAHPLRNPTNPRHPAVHSYALPAELVPIFDQALHRLGR
jgi:hypothetical protein